MKPMQQELLMPSKPYDTEHAVAVAAARVADSPRLVNEALIHLLAGQRGEMDPMVAIAYAIHTLKIVATAPDSLRVEQEALCHSD